MPQPVRISLMRSTAGTASKHSNTQKTVVEDGVNKLPEAAKEERKKIVSNSKIGIKEKIKIKWDEGYRIIAFEYGGGEYLCVMCKLANAKTPMQKYQINSSDINNFIKEIWNDSYDVIYVGG